MRLTPAAERRILLGLAIFAMVWAVVRAHVQAITIDEGVTYSNFVHPEFATYWTPHANNHILNSILVKIVTRLFGASPLAVRSGALLGAAIFIIASYFFSTLIGQSFLQRVSLFICLVFNPFMFDFLVAARGYGLASGFLLSAICLVAYAKKPAASGSPRSLMLASGLASICIALSLLSNFSFAFVDGSCLVLLYLWASAGTPMKTRAALAVSCSLPILLLAAVLAPLLLQWTEPLTWGASSLLETFQSLYEPSFSALNPALTELVSIDVPALIVSLLAVCAVWRLALILMRWRSLRNASGRWWLALMSIPILAVTSALLMHSILYRVTGTPLPRDRTGIYIVVLGTLFLGALAALPVNTRAGDLSRRSLTIMLAVLGSYFLLCLRVSYFKEWKFNADTDKVYSILAYYNHTCGLKDVQVNWHFDGSLNYYLTASGRETLSRFSSHTRYSDDKRAYVLYEFDTEDRDFLASRSLNVIYRSPTGAAIALNPAVSPPPGEIACPLALPDQSK